MSVHLSAFADFVNMFIRYRSRHFRLELSVMATEMVSTFFFLQINYYWGMKILIHFMFAQSLHSAYLIKT